MAKKIKKAIPWFLVASILLVGLIVGLNVLIQNVNAGITPTTGVTVNNVAPDDPTSVAETTESSTTNPTNAGTAVTITATSSDDNGDDWKILVCSTGVVSGTDCAVTKWCESALTSAGTKTCDITTSDSNDWTSPWFTFACDASLCSNYSQGSGATGSPFIVNHAPEFSDVGDNGPKDPGVSITITATAVDDSRDVTGGSGQVQLYVCKTQGSFTGGASPSCGDGEWGHGSLANSNPTAAFAVPNPDGVYNYYPYIVDTWGMVSDGAKQGSAETFTVSNIAPTVTSVQFTNKPQSLTINTTTSVKATASIHDDNGCTKLPSGDEIASATAWFYRHGITCNTGNSNENNCYPDISCSLGDCTAGDLTATCTQNVWYNADPTDEGLYAQNQVWNTNGWVVKVEGKDDDNETGQGDNSAAESDFSTTEGLDITDPSIDYPNLNPGESTVIANNDSVTTNSVGNCPIDNNIHGSTILTRTDDSDTIPNLNQRYGLTNADWASLSDELKDNATHFELAQTTKTTDHNDPIQETIYWGLKIPDVQASGVYAGVNTFAAVEEDTFE